MIVGSLVTSVHVGDLLEVTLSKPEWGETWGNRASLPPARGLLGWWDGVEYLGMMCAYGGCQPWKGCQGFMI
jgi:hypothetical protein